jgi:hypothetical protein
MTPHEFAEMWYDLAEWSIGRPSTEVIAHINRYYVGELHGGERVDGLVEFDPRTRSLVALVSHNGGLGDLEIEIADP